MKILSIKNVKKENSEFDPSINWCKKFDYILNKNNDALKQKYYNGSSYKKEIELIEEIIIKPIDIDKIDDVYK